MAQAKPAANAKVVEERKGPAPTPKTYADEEAFKKAAKENMKTILD